MPGSGTGATDTASTTVQVPEGVGGPKVILVPDVPPAVNGGSVKVVPATLLLLTVPLAMGPPSLCLVKDQYNVVLPAV